MYKNLKILIADNHLKALIPDDFVKSPFISEGELKALYKISQKFLGIDWGEVRIGLAVSDTSGLVASALCIINVPVLKQTRPRKQPNFEKFQKQKEAWWQQLTKIIEKEAPGVIVMGLPKNMDGSLGFQAQKVFAFAKDLSSRICIPIFFQDERLSSVAVERLMIQANFSRNHRKKILDSSSAAFVLQGVLDFLKAFS